MRLTNSVKHIVNTDEVFSFIEVGRGMFKLQNRLFLAETLLAGGHDVEAHKTLDSVRTTNARVVRRFEDGGFRLLGLGRGQVSRQEAIASRPRATIRPVTDI